MSIKENVKGKVLCLTGNNEVGYGAENKPIVGVGVVAEKYEDTTYPLGFNGIRDTVTFLLNATTATALGGEADVQYVVSVDTGVMVEKVGISSTASKQPAAGDIVVCDGSGGVVKAPADYAGITSAMCTAVDTASKTATIKIL